MTACVMFFPVRSLSARRCFFEYYKAEGEFIMKLGIDFGSTYSTFSVYDTHSDTAKALSMSEGSPASIPSAVSLSRNGTVSVGEAAKSQVGSRAYTVFEGFKMLLVESDPAIISGKGYTPEYTPAYITRCFLEQNLEGIAARYSPQYGNIIDDIYICIPEVWSRQFFTLDGRSTLVNILKQIDRVKIRPEGIKVVTEPEAASAYFSYQYEKLARRSFNGHLLLIDYGGGTLDIALTKVKSDGKGKMNIVYQDGGGRGENHPDETGNISLGNAGLAYLQRVVQLALMDDGHDKIDCNSNIFKKALISFEKYLTSSGGTQMIRSTFDFYGSYAHFQEILEEDPQEFFCVEYGDEVVSITYHHILKAYQQTIEDILETEIRTINKKLERDYIHRDPTRPESGISDDFKIALVGGFGSFYLVQKQIAEIYNITANASNDKRLKDICTDQREQAISLGASLLAAGRVHLVNSARYSIGLLSQIIGDTSPQLTFGIRYHQELIPGHPYFLCRKGASDDQPENRMVFTSLRNNINVFALGFSDNFNMFLPLRLKQSMIRKLADIPAEGLWYVGFSIDKNCIVSVHIEPYRSFDRSLKPMCIELASYNDMFGLTTVSEMDIRQLRNIDDIYLQGGQP